MDIYHITNCCRVCLGIKCLLIETTSLDHDSIKLSDKLTACVAEVVWLNEGLPSLICSNCIERLRVAYDFRNVCLKSDQTFKMYVSQVKDENKSDESHVGSTDPLTLHHPGEKSFNSNLTQIGSDRPHLGDAGLKMEDKFEFTSTQVVIETLPCIKEESPNLSQIRFVGTNDCLAKDEYFIEMGEARNCVPESEKCSNYINQTQLKPVIDVIDRRHNIEKPELEEVTQATQMDQRQQLCLQNELLLQHKLQVQQQLSQQKQVINRTTCVQKRPPSPENVTLDGAQCKSYSCAICSKTYRSSTGLTFHMRTHTGEMPFQCKHCKKQFYCSSNLSQHIRTHTGEKPFPCTVCDRRFSVANILKRHMRTHTGEKPYSCDTCGQKFTLSGSLKHHMRIHTGEKLFLCTVCDRRFSMANDLKKHVRTHTGEKPYSCDTCGKKFTTSCILKNHIRTHTGIKLFPCAICDRRFLISNNLKRHMRTHTGEKPYSCNTCGKKFSVSGSLKNHIKTHTIYL